MNVPPWPMNPAVGEQFQNWAWNGTRWVSSRSSGMRVLTTAFTASGPYQPSPGLVSLTVECIGGGGGGGDAGPTDVGNFVFGGGGGGSGGYSRITLPAALVAGGVNVTVGDGGANLSDGGATTFGALCVANGGGAGQQAMIGGSGSGGQGGAQGVGDVAFPGAAGTPGSLIVVTGTLPEWFAGYGGQGGVMFGGNATTLVGQGEWVVGQPGQPNTGAGGCGAVINQLQNYATEVPGGYGGSGICIVTEYCTVETGCQPDPCWPSFPPQWCPPGGWGNDC